MQKVFVNIFLILCIFSPISVQAIGAGDNVPTYEAKIVKIIEEKQIELMGTSQLYQKLELQIISNNRVITVENGNQPLANIIKYKINDKVIISSSGNQENLDEYVITDFNRSDGLIILSVIFILSILVVARGKGFYSIIGMLFTFFVIFKFTLPQILNNNNPIIISILSSLVIIPVSFYLSHGLNKKTTISIIGSIITLTLSIILGSVFIRLGHLTGLSSEEAGMLSLGKTNLDMTGILLAGIIIGALGVLDDVTVSQSAIVQELSQTAKLTKVKDLYSRAMVIGTDHITSMVNTLVLAYAGASMPLMLMFVNNPHPFGEIVNYELIAEEIVRTLVGSIGLVLAVPITTFIAANLYQKK
ncbi:MAG: YibE/F family protein [Candidatus Shapirobacteria bacterium]